MERRVLLKGIAAGVTSVPGCIRAMPLTGSFARRTASLVEIDPPDDYPVSFSVEVTEPEITPEHTARILLTFENDGSTESPGLGHETLGDVHSNDRTMALYAIGIEGPGPTDTCWTTSTFGGLGGDFRSPVTLSPGETWSREYRLWDVTPDTSCMPPGKYRFGMGDSGVDPPFEWRFTLALKQSD